VSPGATLGALGGPRLPPLAVEILPDAAALAERAAEHIAEAVRAAVAARGRFVLAVSGGRTPWAAYASLARVDRALPWERVHVVQVDERVVPADHAERNWSGLLAALGGAAVRARRHPMPVEVAAGLADSGSGGAAALEAELEAAAQGYAAELAGICVAGSSSIPGAGAAAALGGGGPSPFGEPTLPGTLAPGPRIDLVQLGLGADGHTASLLPGDGAALAATADVTASIPHAGHRRLTLTLPCIGRARRIVWVVAGAEKREAVRRLLAGDPEIPAGRVPRGRALLLLDREAHGGAA
jgi:6-phosphogluconolactonase/glucosamine-6-phosphate isomerase/deaminase